MELKPSPQSPMIEMQIFASFLTDRQVFIDYCQLMTPEMFYDSGRKKVFRYMIETQCTDINILGEKFPDEMIMLAECMDNVAGSTNLVPHIDILKDRYYRRCLIDALLILYENVYDNENPIKKHVDEHQQKLLDIQAGISNSRPQRIGEILPEVFSDLEKQYGMTEASIIKTGLIDIDAHAGGFSPGELTIIAGRSSMGKSSMALHIARQNSIAQNIPGLIYSVEMTKILTTSRILFAEAKISYSAIASKSMRIFEPLTNASNRISQANLFVNDNPQITVQQMAIQIEQFVNIYGVQYVLIDHIQKIISNDRRKSRHEQLTEIMNDLSSIGKRNKVPIIAISQLSREVEKRTIPRPQLSDLRESGSIEEIADKVFLLYRPGYYDKEKDDGICEVIIAKNRNGPTGTEKVFWNKELMIFRNLTKGDQEDIKVEWWKL
jgi:replicative DNA helicase